jgi:hypothetical protein
MAPQPEPDTRKGRTWIPPDRTSRRFVCRTAGVCLPRLCPIVLPLNQAKDGPFDPTVSIGDVAIVIFKDMITAAICGDLGPVKKIGEASIRVHEALQPACPDPCRRDGNGFCSKVRNSSVEQDVLYFVFPNSAFANGELTLDNITTKVKERAFALYNGLRGAS